MLKTSGGTNRASAAQRCQKKVRHGCAGNAKVEETESASADGTSFVTPSSALGKTGEPSKSRRDGTGSHAQSENFMLPTIRSATLNDLPAILAIEQHAPSAAHWPADEYEKLILIETGAVLLAEQAGKLRGFVSAKAVADEWEIENIVVATECLRQGIADQLLQALIAQAESADASRILLEVRESNLPARRLYEKHAFREAGRRLKYYNDPLEDAILYEHRCASEQ